MKHYPFCPKLKMWFLEAHKEKNIIVKQINHDYAIYPKRFYENIQHQEDKKYDYIFIGGLHTDRKTYKNRKWILRFIKKRFNDNSYLQFTDRNTKIKHKKMGIFDFTLEKEGFVPKEVKIHLRNKFDDNYFAVMSSSKFCLCPAGDINYSMRFYEALMCKCIPILNDPSERFRSRAEEKLDYKYYLTSDENIEYREDWVEHNYSLFLKYHTLN
tara:strand:- start:3143 stop:3781 length:639 start_codon:yes stop_codon:yes gene_type:complete